jgi:hypothetical protein
MLRYVIDYIEYLMEQALNSSYMVLFNSERRKVECDVSRYGCSLILSLAIYMQVVQLKSIRT